MSFVLDCSMALAWCFHDEQTPATTKVRDSLATETAFVPLVLWDLEVRNALLVAHRRGRIRSVEGNAKLLAGLPIERVAAPIDSVLELAVDHRLSAYDALYLALAQQQRVPLATLDAALAKAALATQVEVLGDLQQRSAH